MTNDATLEIKIKERGWSIIDQWAFVPNSPHNRHMMVYCHPLPMFTALYPLVDRTDTLNRALAHIYEHHIPTRIQRSRRAGATQPPNTIYCGRGSVWGNPFRIVGRAVVDHNGQVLEECDSPDKARAAAIKRYREHLDTKLIDNPSFLDSLRRADYLSCWCNLTQPCHVDVLIEKLKMSYV